MTPRQSRTYLWLIDVLLFALFYVGGTLLVSWLWTKETGNGFIWGWLGCMLYTPLSRFLSNLSREIK